MTSRSSPRAITGIPETESRGHLRWLHLSDLHIGREYRGDWWQIEHAFHDRLAELVSTHGAPHLILLTGDLTNTGASAEFELVDEFLLSLIDQVRPL